MPSQLLNRIISFPLLRGTPVLIYDFSSQILWSSSNLKHQLLGLYHSPTFYSPVQHCSEPIEQAHECFLFFIYCFMQALDLPIQQNISASPRLILNHSHSHQLFATTRTCTEEKMILSQTPLTTELPLYACPMRDRVNYHKNHKLES